MQYIVLDLEWNQALTRESMRRKGFTLVGEIIQIGAVRLDQDLRATDTLRLIVAPKYYTKMHWSVKKLTGISTKMLESGLSFPDAYAQFSDWCGKDITFLTWGPDDLPMLRDNLRLHNMSLSSLPPAFDLQRIFAREVLNKKQQCSLADAMERLDIPQEYPAHDALNDAISTAAVCAKLDLEAGIAHYDDPFPKTDNFDEQTNGLPRTIYPSYSEMAKEEFALSCTCPLCGKTISTGKWVRRAPGKRMSLAICPCGAEHILKVRWKIDDKSGHAFAVRTIEEASEAQKAAYLRAIRQRRRTRRRKSKNSTVSEELTPV